MPFMSFVYIFCTDAQDVVHRLLDRNPVSRFNCLQTYNHRWVEGYTPSRRNEERKGIFILICHKFETALCVILKFRNFSFF